MGFKQWQGRSQYLNMKIKKALNPACGCTSIPRDLMTAIYTLLILGTCGSRASFLRHQGERGFNYCWLASRNSNLDVLMRDRVILPWGLQP